MRGRDAGARASDDAQAWVDVSVRHATESEVARGCGGAARHCADRPPSFFSLPSQLTEKDVRLLSVLGRGASSVVHRGELVASGAPVAVKRVEAATPGARAQVLRDVAALATPPGGVPPPGLVPLLGAYAEEGGGRVALVLRLMEGGSLADAVAARGPLPEAELAAAAAGVLTGLAYIHGQRKMVQERRGGEEREWDDAARSRSLPNPPSPPVLLSLTGPPRY